MGVLLSVSTSRGRALFWSFRSGRCGSGALGVLLSVSARRRHASFWGLRSAPILGNCEFPVSSNRGWAILCCGRQRLKCGFLGRQRSNRRLLLRLSHPGTSLFHYIGSTHLPFSITSARQTSFSVFRLLTRSFSITSAIRTFLVQCHILSARPFRYFIGCAHISGSLSHRLSALLFQCYTGYTRFRITSAISWFMWHSFPRIILLVFLFTLITYNEISLFTLRFCSEHIGSTLPIHTSPHYAQSNRYYIGYTHVPGHRLTSVLHRLCAASGETPVCAEINSPRPVPHLLCFSEEAWVGGDPHVCAGLVAHEEKANFACRAHCFEVSKLETSKLATMLAVRKARLKLNFS